MLPFMQISANTVFLASPRFINRTEGDQRKREHRPAKTALIMLIIKRFDKISRALGAFLRLPRKPENKLAGTIDTRPKQLSEDPAVKLGGDHFIHIL